MTNPAGGSVKLYPDVRDNETGRSAAAVTLSVNSDNRAVIKYLCTNFDIELISGSGADNLEVSSFVLDIDNKRIS